jgi:acyl-CoA synthetase (AMP-forming)/AMP-acid ligase II
VSSERIWADPGRHLPEPVRSARARFEDDWRRQGLHRSQTLAAFLAAGVRDHPGARLIFHSAAGVTELTLADVHRRGRAVATALHRRGLRAGDPIAVQLPNRPETAVAYHAAAALGLVLIPIVPIYGTAEVSFILRQSGARAFVMPSRYRRLDAARDLPAYADLPELLHAIVVGDDVPEGALPWSELEGGDDELPLAPEDSRAVSVLIYTSGTTAEPKGVLHTHDSLIAELANNPTPPLLPGTVTLQPFPAGHTAGLSALLAPAFHGFPTILLDSFDADACADVIEAYGVTSMAGTPFMIAALLDVAERRGTDLHGLAHGITGGGGVPPALIERADAAGWRISRCYGATEGPSLTWSDAGAALEKRAYTDGTSQGGNLIEIVDEDGERLPPGTEGEVVTIGPEQFAGYTDPELTLTAFAPDGWFRTGDIGVIDGDGYLTITDRKKDIIIRGGENISSQEVEAVLVRHPAVADAAVVAVPDERYGERVCAFVVLRPGAQLALEDVQRHFGEAGVARQKTPERLELVDELPRTAAGKVKKPDLRARLR